METRLVIPILKPRKDPSNPSSYRPISLINTLAKVVERIILARLQSFVESHHLIPPNQFGFQRGLSTAMPLCRTVQDGTLALNKFQSIVLIQLDIEKAFDKVWHNGLVFKLLHTHNFPPYLVSLIKHYISFRRIQVRVKNSLSPVTPLSAGVPQGTLLSPLLFNLYLTDIPQYPTTTTLLYADDTAIYTSSFHSQSAIARLQNHLNILTPYYKHWKISINEAKSEFIVLSRRQACRRITKLPSINGVPIHEKRQVDMLGVTLDRWLRFNPHVTKIRQKIAQAFRMLYPLMNRNSPLSTRIKTLLYTTTLRPILLYAAPAWSHISRGQFKRLQIMQNKILRITTLSSRYDSIDVIHQRAGLPRIKEIILDLATKFFKYNIHNSPLTANLTDDMHYEYRVHQYLHMHLDL